MFWEKLAIHLGFLSGEVRLLENWLERPKASVAEDHPSKTSKLIANIIKNLFLRWNAINPFPNLCTPSNLLQHQFCCSFKALACSMEVWIIVTPRKVISFKRRKQLLDEKRTGTINMLLQTKFSSNFASRINILCSEGPVNKQECNIFETWVFMVSIFLSWSKNMQSCCWWYYETPYISGQAPF